MIVIDEILLLLKLVLNKLSIFMTFLIFYNLIENLACFCNTHLLGLSFFLHINIKDNDEIAGPVIYT